MLWKTGTVCHKTVGKARFDSIFCMTVSHRRQFSTAVDNFVENDTHLRAFVVFELRAWRDAFHTAHDAFHVSKNASCRKPLAFFCEMVYHIITEAKDHTGGRLTQ